MKILFLEDISSLNCSQFGKQIIEIFTIAHYEGDMGICGVAVWLVFLCGVAVNKIPSRGVAVISNRTVCGVFDFKPAMFGEKRFLADPLRCCGLLFDTFDRLTLVE